MFIQPNYGLGLKTGKGRFSFQSQRKAMPKNIQATVQLHSFHMLSKVMLKIPQARLQQYVNQELPDVQAGFRKGLDRKSTRLNSSHSGQSRMPSSA